MSSESSLIKAITNEACTICEMSVVQRYIFSKSDFYFRSATFYSLQIGILESERGSYLMYIL